MFEYLPELMKGLHTSLTLTVASLIVALILALIFTIILTLKTPVLVWLVRGYITLFTGTPLLVQIFLIYYGPGQFPTLQEYPALWHLLSEPWLCALIALSLNSAAYTTQLFYGAIRAIPEGFRGGLLPRIPRRKNRRAHLGHSALQKQRKVETKARPLYAV